MTLTKEALNQIDELLERRLTAERAETKRLLAQQHASIIGETRKLLDQQHSDIIRDVQSLLQPIRDDLEAVKKRLEQLFTMVNEDVAAAYADIENLKKRVLYLEKRIAVLER